MKKTELSSYFRKLGKKGGKARAEKLTQEQLREIAKKGGKAGGRGRKKI